MSVDLLSPISELEPAIPDLEFHRTSASEVGIIAMTVVITPVLLGALVADSAIDKVRETKAYSRTREELGMAVNVFKAMKKGPPRRSR